MNPFEQLYSPAQLASFLKVQAALVADPTALDNRGSAAVSVAAFADGTDTGQADGTRKDNQA